MKRIIAIALFLPVVASANWTQTKIDASAVYDGHRVTFYCDCPFEGTRIGKCDFRPARKWRNRARTVEWEHVVPVSKMGCGTRRECAANRHESVYDLHNLVPAIGQVNAYRGNDDYGYVEWKPPTWRGCEAVDSSIAFEPPDDVKGDVARIWLYMQFEHGVPVSPGLQVLLHYWSKQDPVDAWELERDRRITEIQGNSNPFVRIQR